jgi:TPP-dependent pyruvate/acetoin dehydrogenase alpha subunit
MYRAQRQGKASFYVKSTGEEAVSAAQAAALELRADNQRRARVAHREEREQQ